MWVRDKDGDLVNLAHFIGIIIEANGGQKAVVAIGQDENRAILWEGPAQEAKAVLDRLAVELQAKPL